MDSRFRGNDIKGSGNDRKGAPHNNILNRRDACPTLLAGLGLPRRFAPRNDRGGRMNTTPAFYYFLIVLIN